MKVCVTGAAGFVAGHLVKLLLERGYIVQGTVRSLKDEKRYKHLKSLKGSENLKLFEADLLKEHSFDEAVRGCDAVFHTASPFFWGAPGADPQKSLVEPAVNGTLNVLKSVQSCGKSVKKVILTSSIAAVSPALNRKETLDESQWNTKSSLERGPYLYSKVLAERAAWDFVEREKPSWELVSINPSMVIGPGLNPFERKEDVNTSTAVILHLMDGTLSVIPNGGINFVDVRDVAAAHIAALEKKSKGRYLIAAHSATYKFVADYLRKLGYQTPSQVQKEGDVAIVNNKKSREELGIEYMTLEKSLEDTASQLVRDGLLKIQSKL